MNKRKQQYDIENGSSQHADPRAHKSSRKKLFKPMRLPRYTVDTYLASKGVDVKGEMSSG